jgi:hypothetical protein
VVDPATTPRAVVVWTGRDAFVVCLSWRPVGQQADQERFQVLSLEDGKVRRMAEYRTRDEAIRIAKRLVERGESKKGK